MKKHMDRASEDIFNFNDDIETGLNLTMFVATFAVLFGVFVFAFIVDGINIDDEVLAFDYNDKITGYATSDATGAGVEEEKKDYEIRIAYSPEFKIEVDSNRTIVLKKDILIFREKVLACKRGGEGLEDCVHRTVGDSSSRFRLNCNLDIDRDVKEIAKKLEICNAVEDSSCACKVDFSGIGKGKYLINLDEIDSVAVYEYDSDLAGDAKEDDLDESDMEEYLKRSIIVRGISMLDNGNDNTLFDISDMGSSFFVKENNTLNLLNREEVTRRAMEEGLVECELEDSTVYDFCLKEDMEFIVNGEKKKVVPEFSIDFS